MIDKLFEWLFENYPFIFDAIVFILLVIIASGIDKLILMWVFS